MNGITTDPPCETSSALLPRLIVVTGRPGAGKSTLAHALAAAVRCPAICRDEIKEGLINTLGSDPAVGDDIARQAYHVFFDTVADLLRRRVTLVAEAAFQHKLWAPKLQPLRDLAQLRVIVCDVTADLAHSRRLDRGRADPDRARFHPDPLVQAIVTGGSEPPANYDPPRLDVPTLTVDTSDGYEPPIADLVAFALA